MQVEQWFKIKQIPYLQLLIRMNSEQWTVKNEYIKFITSTS